MRVLIFVAALSFTLPAFAGQAGDLAVIVDGSRAPEYEHRGTRYVEAIRGREFSLRLRNPTPYRVAVALAVDGLNTIDAKHTDGWRAAKWVLAPYETAEITGWQVSDQHARRFYFTGERSSYGAKLGQTDNLGVIEAIFYRERPRAGRMEVMQESAAAPSAAPSYESSGGARQKALSDSHAATGMGDRTRHDVSRVAIDLDPDPIARFRVRYEFRPQLVKLGVLPRDADSLTRRERARGFEFCPE